MPQYLSPLKIRLLRQFLLVVDEQLLAFSDAAQCVHTYRTAMHGFVVLPFDVWFAAVVEEGVERVDGNMRMSVNGVLAGVVPYSSSQCLQDPSIKVVTSENIDAEAGEHFKGSNNVCLTVERLMLITVIHCCQLVHKWRA